MPVNQAQVDSIISSASAEDPEIQLLKLRDEVELLKTSIKRLLIDIRERMNDAENPLVQALKGNPVDFVGQRSSGPSPMEGYIDDYDEETSGGDVSEVGEMSVSNEPEVIESVGQSEPVEPAMTGGGAASVSSALSSLAAEKGMLDALRNQLFTQPVQQQQAAELARPKKPREKIKIQKVYSLFEWTTNNVKRYGHDRVDLMLESYKEMGHISDDHCKQVKDIARLMAPSIGEVHEMKADEFVLALYELNRILQPEDAGLDRDMLDVLIEKRKSTIPAGKIEDADNIIEDDLEFEYIPSRE
jgi:archaellum component FlaD/FlaE